MSKKDRVKGNVKSAKSESAASLLGTGVQSTFVGFDCQSSFVLLPEVQSHLKKLSKKDANTKVKSLNDLKQVLLLDGEDNEEYKSEVWTSVLPQWCRFYPKLCMDEDTSVRKHTQMLHNLIVSNTRKDFVPYMKLVTGYWGLSMFDTYAPAAKEAHSAFFTIFPNDKWKNALVFCKDEIVCLLLEYFEMKESSLKEKDTDDDPESASRKYNRLITQTLAFTCFLLNSQCDELKLTLKKSLIPVLIKSESFLKLINLSPVSIQKNLLALLSTITFDVDLTKCWDDVEQPIDKVNLKCLQNFCLQQDDEVMCAQAWRLICELENRKMFARSAKEEKDWMKKLEAAVSKNPPVDNVVLLCEYLKTSSWWRGRQEFVSSWVDNLLAATEHALFPDRFGERSGDYGMKALNGFIEACFVWLDYEKDEGGVSYSKQTQEVVRIYEKVHQFIVKVVREVSMTKVESFSQQQYRTKLISLVYKYSTKHAFLFDSMVQIIRESFSQLGITGSHNEKKDEPSDEGALVAAAFLSHFLKPSSSMSYNGKQGKAVMFARKSCTLTRKGDQSGLDEHCDEKRTSRARYKRREDVESDDDDCVNFGLFDEVYFEFIDCYKQLKFDQSDDSRCCYCYIELVSEVYNRYLDKTAEQRNEFEIAGAHEGKEDCNKSNRECFRIEIDTLCSMLNACCKKDNRVISDEALLPSSTPISSVAMLTCKVCEERDNASMAFEEVCKKTNPFIVSFVLEAHLKLKKISKNKLSIDTQQLSPMSLSPKCRKCFLTNPELLNVVTKGIKKCSSWWKGVEAIIDNEEDDAKRDFVSGLDKLLALISSNLSCIENNEAVVMKYIDVFTTYLTTHYSSDALINFLGNPATDQQQSPSQYRSMVQLWSENDHSLNIDLIATNALSSIQSSEEYRHLTPYVLNAFIPPSMSSALSTCSYRIIEAREGERVKYTIALIDTYLKLCLSNLISNHDYDKSQTVVSFGDKVPHFTPTLTPTSGGNESHLEAHYVSSLESAFDALTTKFNWTQTCENDLRHILGCFVSNINSFETKLAHINVSSYEDGRLLKTFANICCKVFVKTIEDLFVSCSGEFLNVLMLNGVCLADEQFATLTLEDLSLNSVVMLMQIVVKLHNVLTYDNSDYNHNTQHGDVPSMLKMPPCVGHINDDLLNWYHIVKLTSQHCIPFHWKSSNSDKNKTLEAPSTDVETEELFSGRLFFEIENSNCFEKLKENHRSYFDSYYSQTSQFSLSGMEGQSDARVEQKIQRILGWGGNQTGAYSSTGSSVGDAELFHRSAAFLHHATVCNSMNSSNYITNNISSFHQHRHLYLKLVFNHALTLVSEKEDCSTDPDLVRSFDILNLQILYSLSQQLSVLSSHFVYKNSNVNLKTAKQPGKTGRKDAEDLSDGNQTNCEEPEALLELNSDPNDASSDRCEDVLQLLTKNWDSTLCYLVFIGERITSRCNRSYEDMEIFDEANTLLHVSMAQVFIKCFYLLQKVLCLMALCEKTTGKQEDSLDASRLAETLEEWESVFKNELEKSVFYLIGMLIKIDLMSSGSECSFTPVGGSGMSRRQQKEKDFNSNIFTNHFIFNSKYNVPFASFVTSYPFLSILSDNSVCSTSKSAGVPVLPFVLCYGDGLLSKNFNVQMVTLELLLKTVVNAQFDDTESITELANIILHVIDTISLNQDQKSVYNEEGEGNEHDDGIRRCDDGYKDLESHNAANDEKPLPETNKILHCYETHRQLTAYMTSHKLLITLLNKYPPSEVPLSHLVQQPLTHGGGSGCEEESTLSSHLEWNYHAFLSFLFKIIDVNHDYTKSAHWIFRQHETQTTSTSKTTLDNLNAIDHTLSFSYFIPTVSSRLCHQTGEKNISTNVVWEDGGNQLLSDLAVDCYLAALIYTPTLCRNWFEGLDRRRREIVDIFTTRNLSPFLVKQALISIDSDQQKQINNENEERLTIKILQSQNVVQAQYSIEDFAVDVKLAFSKNYPLGRINIEEIKKKKIGIKDEEWNRLLLDLRISLEKGSGSIVCGIIGWKSTLEKIFRGVEECCVCMAVLHPTNRSLPTKPCKVCKKKFHAVCLYTWFEKGTANCPYCRSVF